MSQHEGRRGLEHIKGCPMCRHRVKLLLLSLDTKRDQSVTGIIEWSKRHYDSKTGHKR